MEIVLHPTLSSQIILSFRKSLAGSEIEQVLVAIVKGTFQANDASAVPMPPEQQLPLFLQDVFLNVVRNADFAVGQQTDGEGKIITPIAGWESESPIISQIEAAPPNSHFMRVEGSGRVIQRITFDRPLGGRTFWLRFQARASVATIVQGIQLETSSGKVLFAGNRFFLPGFSTYLSSPTTFPEDLEDTEAILVLMGIEGGVAIDYDRVQLTESKTVFAFDEKDPVRYEHDLATYKSYSDLVMLGRPAPPEPGAIANRWTEQISINGTTLTGTFNGGVLETLNGTPIDPVSLPWSVETPITFGWESRVLEPPGRRKGYAGTYGADTTELPEDFNNLFFNGGLYTSAGQPAFNYVAPDTMISVTTTAQYDNGGTPEVRTASTTLHLPSTSPQFTVTYRTRAALNSPTVKQIVTMNADTVVYDKDTNHFYVVWRGVWDYISIPADRYVSVALS